MVLFPLLLAPANTVIGARSISVLPLNDLKFVSDHFRSILRYLCYLHQMRRLFSNLQAKASPFSTDLKKGPWSIVEGRATSEPAC